MDIRFRPPASRLTAPIGRATMLAHNFRCIIFPILPHTNSLAIPVNPRLSNLSDATLSGLRYVPTVTIPVPRHQPEPVKVIALKVLSTTRLFGDPLRLSVHVVASPRPLHDTPPLSRRHRTSGFLYTCSSRSFLLSLIVRNTFYSLSLLFLLFYIDPEAFCSLL